LSKDAGDNVTVGGVNAAALLLATSGTTRITLTSTTASYTPRIIEYTTATPLPELRHKTDPTNGVVGDLFIRNSQDCSGTGATVGGATVSRAGDATGPGPNTGGDYTARPGAGTVGGTYAIANGAGADVVHADDTGWYTDDAVHHNRTTVTGPVTYAVVATDHVLGTTTAGGVAQIDLPPAASHAGRHLLIKDEGGAAAAFNIIVNGNAAETIDGALTAVLLANFAAINIYCDGSNWFIY
jgi:hypothetical protein